MIRSDIRISRRNLQLDIRATGMVQSPSLVRDGDRIVMDLSPGTRRLHVNILDGERKGDISAFLRTFRVFSGGGGQVPENCVTWDDVIPSDFRNPQFSDDNILTSLAALSLLLRKDQPDFTEHLIRFLGGAEFGEFNKGMMTGTGGRIDEKGNAELTSLVLRQFLEFGEFNKGMITGTGGRIDSKGDAELNSLILRQFLEVPELRYNRITVVGDEQWGTQGGIIESIVPDGNPDDNQYRIQLKLEEGDVNPFRKGDVIKGIFHGKFINSEGIEVEGFYSMYAIVVSEEDEPNFEQGLMLINLTGYKYKPQPQMVIARMGNSLYKVDESGATVPVYPERQRSWRISVREGNFQFYDNVDSWEITPKNIKLHCGECKDVGLPGVPETAEGFVFWGFNLYSVGGITQIDVEGNEVPPIVFMGEWKAGVTYTKNNQVTYKGCIYLCIVKSTTAEPRYDSSDWLMVVGDPDLKMRFESSAGDVLIEGDLNTTITAYVSKFNQDLTTDIVKEQWIWTRESAFPDSDLIWNKEHIGYGNVLDITEADLPGSGMRRIRFTCTAYITEIESVSAIVEL